MSKLSLTGNASGTGTFTIAAPNSNSDRTLTLPDEAGTLVTKDGSGTVVSTNISDGTNSTSTTNVVKGSARAWVYFDAADGSPEILQSYNVTSVGDDGVGQYLMNFTTAMSSTDFLCVGSARGGTNGLDDDPDICSPIRRTASQVFLKCRSNSNTDRDSTHVSAVVLL